MADVITRFKLETTQFDSKLRDSAQSLSQLTRHLQLAGKDFDRFAQQHVEVARSFGQVASGATNLKDELKDLVGAYNKVANAYNAMTQEQKQGDYGKAMAASLQQLQGRIKDVKSEMNSAPGILDQLKDKLTVNIDAVKLFNIGLQAAEGVLKVAKDAFFASESSVDEWGRTMQAAEGVYEGFLSAINNGDISGFLNNINDIVSAARKAYDELDLLGTMKTIQAPQVSAQRTENERFRLMIQTGRYIAPLDGRRNAVFNGQEMQNGQLLTPEQIRTLERQLQGGTQKMVTLVGNEVKQTGKAIDAYYDSIAKQNGMSLHEFKKGTSTWDEFKKKIKGFEEYKKFEDSHTQVVERYNKETGLNDVVSIRDNERNPYEEFRKWGNFRVDKMGKNSFNDLVQLIQQRDQQASQAYSTLSTAYRTINRAEGISTRKLLEGGGGGKGGNTKVEVEAVSGSIDEQTKLVQELQKAWRAAANDDSRQKIKAEIEEQQYLLDRMTGKEKFDPTKMGPIADLTGRVPVPDFGVDMKRGKNGNWYDATAPVAPDTIKFSDSLQKRMDYEEKQRIKDNEKKEVNLTSEMSKIAGGVSGIFSGIESLGVELPQGLKDVMGGIQGVISIMTSISTILSAIEAINAADTLIPFAGGGIIKAAGGTIVGNSYSGDNLRGIGPGGQLYGLNAQEVVLNRAQQGNLVSQLEGANGRSVNVRGVLQGEQIFLAAERWSKRTGKGEFVTW